MAKLDDFITDRSESKVVKNNETGKRRRVWRDGNNIESVDVENSEALITLEKLRKNPLNVVYFLYDNIENKQKRVTRKIASGEMVDALNITRDSLKTALKFLMKYAVINRVSFEPGKGGGVIYKISLSVFKDIEKMKQ